ncbi:MAG: GNAT family N-acetyltransferase [Henriciella sp.]|nr:GNAT family N-acetyltransferase [Henriciella sp.]
MTLRGFLETDLPELHKINQDSVPGVSSETEADLLKWINLSTVFIAVDPENRPLGFITLVEPGTKDYPSANLRWFEARLAREGGDVIYVDRIAVSDCARGRRLGEKLYQAAFSAFAHRGEIGCEVNIEPPNPGSHRFHQRLGFKQIGERSYDEGRKSVAYYVRALG